MPGITSTYSPLFLLIILIISLSLSIYFYRNILLNKIKKLILITLKSIALFLLLTLFIEPVINIVAESRKPTKNIILIDLSRSNKFDNKYLEILNILSNIESEKNNVIFGFSNNSEKFQLNDSIRFNGYSTNLTNSLKIFQEKSVSENINSIILLSDGIITEGGNPVYEAKNLLIPFIIIPIGDTVKKNDISVKEVITTPKAIAGTNVKVRVIINSYLSEKKNIKVRLFREGSEIKTANLDIEPDKEYYELTFNVLENEAGKYKYKIETEIIHDEYTYLNNYENFFITFIDNKINVLTISGGPGYDNEFLGSIIKRIGKYDIIYRTLKSQSEFYEGVIDNNIFKELSNVIFINFPNSNTDLNFFKNISDNIKINNLPLLFFSGKNTDYQKLNLLEEIIPFSVTNINSSENLIKLRLVESPENPLEKITNINNMQDLFMNVSGVIVKPGSLTYAINHNQSLPLIIHRNTGKSLSTAFLGYGLWKWKLNKNINNEKIIEEMLLELLNITIQTEKPSRLKVYLEKDIFDYTERISIFAEYYDENYTLIRNAKLRGWIINRLSGKIIENIEFKPYENKYRAEINPLNNGDYIIECETENSGEKFIKTNNRFIVDTLNNEFKELRTNYKLFNELATITGGKLIPRDSIKNANEIIKNLKNSRMNNSSLTQVYYDLSKNKYFLIIIIFIYSLEWILRKRNNIA